MKTFQTTIYFERLLFFMRPPDWRFITSPNCESDWRFFCESEFANLHQSPGHFYSSIFIGGNLASTGFIHKIATISTKTILSSEMKDTDKRLL